MDSVKKEKGVWTMREIGPIRKTFLEEPDPQRLVEFDLSYEFQTPLNSVPSTNRART